MLGQVRFLSREHLFKLLIYIIIFLKFSYAFNNLKTFLRFLLIAGAKLFDQGVASNLRWQSLLQLRHSLSNSSRLQSVIAPAIELAS